MALTSATICRKIDVPMLVIQGDADRILVNQALVDFVGSREAKPVA